jgi:hypothetical protein
VTQIHFLAAEPPDTGATEPTGSIVAEVVGTVIAGHGNCGFAIVAQPGNYVTFRRYASPSDGAV